MDLILKLARQHHWAIVEDNADGLVGKYRGRFLGTLGDLAALSFHDTKTFTSGEGAALLISGRALVAREGSTWEKDNDRSRFFRGDVDKCNWVDVCSSYLAADLLAAVRLAQLKHCPQIESARDQGMKLPFLADCEQGHHMFYVFLPKVVPVIVP